MRTVAPFKESLNYILITVLDTRGGEERNLEVGVANMQEEFWKWEESAQDQGIYLDLSKGLSARGNEMLFLLFQWCHEEDKRRARLSQRSKKTSYSCQIRQKVVKKRSDKKLSQKERSKAEEDRVRERERE